MPPHCDSLDGPVVKAARHALETRNVQWVLPFAPAEAEKEIRDAFHLALAVRPKGAEAAHVADTWFFETVVRLHRASEGASFMGLKPAGLDVGPVVPLAERALETGDPKPLYRFLVEAVHRALHEKYDVARRLQDHDPSDVAAARAYTSAMLGFILWSHRTYKALGQSAHEPQDSAVHAPVASGHAH